VLTNPGCSVVLPLLRDQLLPGTVHKAVLKCLVRSSGSGEAITIANATAAGGRCMCAKRCARVGAAAPAQPAAAQH